MSKARELQERAEYLQMSDAEREYTEWESKWKESYTDVDDLLKGPFIKMSLSEFRGFLKNMIEKEGSTWRGGKIE